jgi:uncharacterized cupin superfamily protein
VSKKIALSTVVVKSLPVKSGSGYPSPYNQEVLGRSRWAGLGDVFGLDQFGVNVVTLLPGAWSSHRHWHEQEDEFVYMHEGEVTLTDDFGDHVLKPGMCAGFRASNGNGHHLKNLTDKPAVYLEMGSRKSTDSVTYSDIDMKAVKDQGPWKYMKKDGTAF